MHHPSLLVPLMAAIGLFSFSAAYAQHASKILGAHPEIAEMIAVWFEQNLGHDQ